MFSWEDSGRINKKKMLGSNSYFWSAYNYSDKMF